MHIASDMAIVCLGKQYHNDRDGLPCVRDGFLHWVNVYKSRLRVECIANILLLLTSEIVERDGTHE